MDSPSTSKEPYEPKQTSNDLSPYLVAHWTEEEKHILYQSMRRHSSINYDALAKEHPTKTKQEIIDAIEYYRQATIKLYGSKISERGRRMKPKDKPLDIGLTFWINILAKTFNTAELNTDLSEALMIIAENSNIPPPDATHGLDFKNIYIYLAKILIGEPGPCLNRISTLLVKKCVNDTLSESNKSLLLPNIENCLELMVNPQETVMPLKSDTKDPEERLVEFIISQRNFNPFGIELKFLEIQNYPEVDDY